MISRRSMLIGAAGAVAVAPFAGAGPAEAAPPGIREAPETVARRRRDLGGRSLVSARDLRLTHLGIAWTGAEPPLLRLRTGAGWTTVPVTEACRRDQLSHDGGGGSTLVPAPDVSEYLIEAAPRQQVDVLELDTEHGPRTRVREPLGRPVAAAPRRAARKGSWDGVLAWWAQRRRDGRYLSRVDWGANDALRRRNADGTSRAEYTGIQAITVHHSGFDVARAPAATVRGIYATDVLHDGYDDLGYHLLIDDFGRIYEGRWSGTDGLPVFGPDRDAAGRWQMVNGAHVKLYNAANIGICLLGNFSARRPTAAMRTALRDVVAMLCAQCHLDPVGSSHYLNPLSGAQAMVRTVAGHRDWAATQCPGNLFYPQLETVRRDAKALMH